MKLSSKQKTDIQMLKHSIEIVKAGGVLSWIHVSKSKAAHEKLLRAQEKLMTNYAPAPRKRPNLKINNEPKE